MKRVPPLRTIGRAVLRRRGLGFIQDRDQQLARQVYSDFDRLALPAPFGISGFSVEQWMPDAESQGAANACVGFALSTAEFITLRARHGLDAEPPSRRWLYYWARWDDGYLDDVGCWPARALQSMAERGVIPESYWPYSVARINEKPPVRLRFDARERTGYRDSYEIRDRGDTTIAAVRAALAAKRTVAIGVPWDERLYKGAPSTYDGPRGNGRGFHWDQRTQPLGNHMVTGVAMEYHAGEWWIRILNSHGRTWNLDGTAWLSEEYVRHALSLIVVDPKEPGK